MYANRKLRQELIAWYLWGEGTNKFVYSTCWITNEAGWSSRIIKLVMPRLLDSLKKANARPFILTKPETLNHQEGLRVTLIGVR